MCFRDIVVVKSVNPPMQECLLRFTPTAPSTSAICILFNQLICPRSALARTSRSSPAPPPQWSINSYWTQLVSKDLLGPFVILCWHFNRAFVEAGWQYVIRNGTARGLARAARCGGCRGMQPILTDWAIIWTYCTEPVGHQPGRFIFFIKVCSWKKKSIFL